MSEKSDPIRSALGGSGLATATCATRQLRLRMALVFFRPAVDAICEVIGRRHRVSPSRSAYFASPWWLLTLDLVDVVVGKQLYYSQSRDGI